jgi:hypothetical protein
MNLPALKINTPAIQMVIDTKLAIKSNLFIPRIFRYDAIKIRAMLDMFCSTLPFVYTSVFPNDFPNKSDRTNNIRKTKNKIFAIPAAPAAIPPNPNNAATNAIIKNVTVQRSISCNF